MGQKGSISRVECPKIVSKTEARRDRFIQKQKKILTWRHNQFPSFSLQLLASQQRREPTSRVADRHPSFYVFSNIWWSFYQFSAAEKNFKYLTDFLCWYLWSLGQSPEAVNCKGVSAYHFAVKTFIGTPKLIVKTKFSQLFVWSKFFGIWWPLLYLLTL